MKRQKLFSAMPTLAMMSLAAIATAYMMKSVNTSEKEVGSAENVVYIGDCDLGPEDDTGYFIGRRYCRTHHTFFERGTHR